MRRLYLRVYLAVLASLAVFALAAGFLWRQLGDPGPQGFAFEVAGTLAVNALPPAGAPPREQQRALERLSHNLRADVALYSPARERLAAVGEVCRPRDPAAGAAAGCGASTVHPPGRCGWRTAAGWWRACRATIGIPPSGCS